MAEVESFTLDHNKVIAPYVRLIANEHGRKGDVISNFDIRFLQPNKQEMPTGVVHTFEHIFKASPPFSAETTVTIHCLAQKNTPNKYWNKVLVSIHSREKSFNHSFSKKH